MGISPGLLITSPYGVTIYGFSRPGVCYFIMGKYLSNKERELRDKKFILGFHFCTKCRKFLPVSHFRKNKDSYYGLSLWCNTCFLPNDRKISRERSSFYKIKYLEMKKHYTKLFGDKCAKCGYRKALCSLDFHHIDQKKYNPTSAIYFNNEQVALSELNKCILLCSNCHRELENRVWDAEFIKEEFGYSISRIKFDNS